MTRARTKFVIALLLPAGCGAEAPIAPGPSAVPADFTVTLTRSVCFGTCPSYTARIDQSGLVQWQGRACVAHSGEATAQRQASVAVQVFQALVDGDFWSYQDSYTSAEDGCEVWSDSPTTEIKVQTAGYDKTVVHYYGCKGIAELDQLITLEGELDRLIDTEDWVALDVTKTPTCASELSGW